VEVQTLYVGAILGHDAPERILFFVESRQEHLKI
jgi:hypothetical protein